MAMGGYSRGHIMAMGNDDGIPRNAIARLLRETDALLPQNPDRPAPDSEGDK